MLPEPQLWEPSRWKHNYTRFLPACARQVVKNPVFVLCYKAPLRGGKDRSTGSFNVDSAAPEESNPAGNGPLLGAELRSPLFQYPESSAGQNTN